MYTDSIGIGDVAGAVGAFAGLMIFLYIFLVLIVIAGYVVFSLGLMKVFTKAGKPGWAAWVPGYNIWVQCEVAGCHWALFAIALGGSVLTAIPYIGSMFALAVGAAGYFISYNMAKKFGKGIGFSIALTLVGVVCYPILGFGKDAYKAEEPVKNCAFFNI